jgi:hypothetical protein
MCSSYFLFGLLFLLSERGKDENIWNRKVWSDENGENRKIRSFIICIALYTKWRRQVVGTISIVDLKEGAVFVMGNVTYTKYKFFLFHNCGLSWWQFCLKVGRVTNYETECRFICLSKNKMYESCM